MLSFGTNLSGQTQSQAVPDWKGGTIISCWRLQHHNVLPHPLVPPQNSCSLADYRRMPRDPAGLTFNLNFSLLPLTPFFQDYRALPWSHDRLSMSFQCLARSCVGHGPEANSADGRHLSGRASPYIDPCFNGFEHSRTGVRSNTHNHSGLIPSDVNDSKGVVCLVIRDLGVENPKHLARPNASIWWELIMHALIYSKLSEIETLI
ncbi:hypothetical protein K439DRAFT_855281 [Ramaria rubella]|nr:hypothetical protein K439DRAFT_855281 [Ramaria rubella]